MSLVEVLRLERKAALGLPFVQILNRGKMAINEWRVGERHRCWV
jgi:hypothetical protein